MWILIELIAFYSAECFASWAGYPDCVRYNFYETWVWTDGFPQSMYYSERKDSGLRRKMRYAANQREDLKKCMQWSKGLLGENYDSSKAPMWYRGILMQVPRYLEYPKSLKEDYISNSWYTKTMGIIYTVDYWAGYYSDLMIDFVSPYHVEYRGLVGTFGMYMHFCSIEPLKLVKGGLFEIRYYKKRLWNYKDYENQMLVNFSFINRKGKSHLLVFLDLGGLDGWRRQVSKSTVEAAEPVRIHILFNPPVKSYLLVVDSFRYIENEDNINACRMYDRIKEYPVADPTPVPVITTEPPPTPFIPIDEGTDFQYWLWLNILKHVSAEMLMVSLTVVTFACTTLIFCCLAQIRLSHDN